MIAAFHLDPRLTGPVAIVIAGVLVWYWIRLGRGDVPRGRRRLRRLSLLLMLVSLPNFVRGLSYLDPAAEAVPYVVSWSLSLLLVLLIFATACADALLTLRVQRRVRADELARTGAEIVRAVRASSGVPRSHEAPSSEVAAPPRDGEAR